MKSIQNRVIWLGPDDCILYLFTRHHDSLLTGRRKKCGLGGSKDVRNTDIISHCIQDLGKNIKISHDVHIKTKVKRKLGEDKKKILA